MTLSLLTRSMFHATRSLRHFSRIFLALISLLATVQCALPTADNAKQTAILADMPEMSPSALSPAMACVDKRLMGNNRRQFRLTSEFIRDPSGLVAGEFYNVVAAAVGEISQRSRAFAFLDGGKEGSIERASPAERYRGRVEDKTPPPHYYFAGAITRAVSRSAYGSRGGGGSARSGNFGIEGGVDREVSFSFIELTLRLINFDDNEQVATARHSITFSESNHGVDLSGTLLPAGLTYKYSSGVSEGAHTAVRALIDLSVASLLGRQAGIRFDDCFKNTASTAAPAETDETTQARQALKQLGFSDSKPLHEVLAEFQIEAGLHPSGTLSYETRRALGLNGQKIIQLPRPDLRVDVLPIDYQNGVTAKVDAIFGISVSVSRSTEVWCYVQPPSSGTSAVLKIFPNRDMPNAHFTAGTRRDIPPFDSQPFLLNADAPGQWQVGCAAVPRPISGQIAEASAKSQQMVLRGWDLDQIASNLRSASDETLFAKRTFNVAR